MRKVKIIFGIILLLIAAFFGVFLVRFSWLIFTGVGGWDTVTMGLTALFFVLPLLSGVFLLKKSKKK